MLEDKDLLSVQEARALIKTAKAAQKILSEMSQERIDNIVKKVSEAGLANAERLAKMANEETGFGIWQDKVIKNEFASRAVYESIKDLKTVGIINEDGERKIFEVAVPVGVISALIPSTNPTSTVIFKAMIALKSANAIIFSPHPSALKCITETVALISKAAKEAGAPDGVVSCLSIPTKEGTDELMRKTSLILATGGGAMVKAAYSSGTPAIGVGPGNTPAFIERSADIKQAVAHIVASKSFDNSTICASEQSVVVESCIKDDVVKEFKLRGGYFLNEAEREKVAKLLRTAQGGMNPKIVGKSAETVAEMAGISVPRGTKVLLSEETDVGHHNPYSCEKLTTVLGFYTENDWETACHRCIELLTLEGAGHTLVIHSRDEAVIREFGLKKPVSRLLVNTLASLGAVGATTNLVPSLTLGCGAVGGNATSDNVGPLNLLNIRRVAWGVREIEKTGNNETEELIRKIVAKLLKGEI